MLALLIVALAALASASGVHLSRLLGWDEAAELVRRLDIRPGTTVADVGAGTGWLAVAVARHVGPEGHVFATELSAERLADIRRSVADAALTNVTVIEAGARETGLPTGCCALIYMRNVYHHVTVPAALNASLYEAVAPGGRLAVVDFEPRGVLRWFHAGAAADRDGHGVWRTRVIEELGQPGFELTDREERWGRLGYLLVFRRPRVQRR